MTAYVAVVGAGTADPSTDAAAAEVGRRLAEAGAIVITGGLGGVMAAACKGAKAAGGTTVGILPGSDRASANPYVDVAIATGMGEMRNALVVRAADAVLAVGGGFGTLSEIAFALKIGKPVVGLGSWRLNEARPDLAAMLEAATPEDAVATALNAITATS